MEPRPSRICVPPRTGVPPSTGVPFPAVMDPFVPVNAGHSPRRYRPGRWWLWFARSSATEETLILRVVVVKGSTEDELVKEERPTPERGRWPGRRAAGGSVGRCRRESEEMSKRMEGCEGEPWTYSAFPCRELRPIGNHWTAQSQR